MKPLFLLFANTVQSLFILLYLIIIAALYLYCDFSYGNLRFSSAVDRYKLTAFFQRLNPYTIADIQRTVVGCVFNNCTHFIVCRHSFKLFAQIARLKQKLEQKQERLDSQREKIIREANEEAHAILRKAKEVADQTIKNFHKYGKGSGSVREMEKERGSLRNKMDQLEKDMSLKQKEQAANHKVPKKLRIGDSVKVLSMNLKGTVHTLPNDKGDLYVQMGILRSVVNINDLVLLEEDPPSVGKKYSSAGAGNLKMSKSASVSTEINLIGKTTDEAIVLLDKYLDDAYLAHMPSVRIVHGKGTGALRKAVQNHLKRLKYVKSFRLGEFGEGDSGVTIAEFH